MSLRTEYKELRGKAKSSIVQAEEGKERPSSCCDSSSEEEEDQVRQILAYILQVGTLMSENPPHRPMKVKTSISAEAFGMFNQQELGFVPLVIAKPAAVKDK